MDDGPWRKYMRINKSLLGIDTEYNFDLKASEFYKNINICNVAYCFKLKRL